MAHPSRRKPREAKRSGTASSRPRRDPRVLGGALAAVAAIVIAVVVFRSTRAPRIVAIASDPLAAVDPASAFRTAMLLGQSGKSFESLPYFERSLLAQTSERWRIHRNYAAALDNATVESRSIAGLVVPVTRSSYERVGMARAALADLDAADRSAPDPAAHASIEKVRNTVLELWGFAGNGPNAAPARDEPAPVR